MASLLKILFWPKLLVGMTFILLLFYRALQVQARLYSAHSAKIFPASQNSLLPRGSLVPG